MKWFEYTVQDELGIHARPAGMLVKQAATYQCAIAVVCGEKQADAKKVFRMMALGAKQGQTIRVECDGPDEEAAAAELEALVKRIL